MNPELQIRSELPTDLGGIAQVNILAFNRPDEAQLVASLRTCPDYDARLSLVAMIERIIIGHALFFPVSIQSETGMHPSLGLGPVAVLPEYQQQGIGSALIRAGLAQAKALGHCSSVVLGHSSYYPRFGYQPARRWGIRCCWDVPAEAFMALELVPGALVGKTGTAVYAEPFYAAT